MDIWETNKLVLFIAFVIPGFVSLKTYQLLVPSDAKDSAAQLIDAVAYSCINYALLYFPIHWVEIASLQIGHPWLYALFYAMVLLIAPIAWVVVFRWLRLRPFLLNRLPHPTRKPWDYVFGDMRKELYVCVVLKSGRKIGGLYAARSFASSAPAPEQIYLEEAWEVNDEGFVRAYNETAGVLVLSSEIETLELFWTNDRDRHGQQQNRAGWMEDG